MEELAPTITIYLAVILIIWKFTPNLETFLKIILSIIMLPIIYIIVKVKA